MRFSRNFCGRYLVDKVLCGRYSIKPQWPAWRLLIWNVYTWAPLEGGGKQNFPRKFCTEDINPARNIWEIKPLQRMHQLFIKLSATNGHSPDHASQGYDWLGQKAMPWHEPLTILNLEYATIVYNQSMPNMHLYNAKYAMIQCQICCTIGIVCIFGIGWPVKMALCAQMALCA